MYTCTFIWKHKCTCVHRCLPSLCTLVCELNIIIVHHYLECISVNRVEAVGLVVRPIKKKICLLPLNDPSQPVNDNMNMCGHGDTVYMYTYTCSCGISALYTHMYMYIVQFTSARTASSFNSNWRVSSKVTYMKLSSSSTSHRFAPKPLALRCVPNTTLTGAYMYMNKCMNMHLNDQEYYHADTWGLHVCKNHTRNEPYEGTHHKIEMLLEVGHLLRHGS